MQDIGVRQNFGMTMIRPVNGRDVWLSLDDAHCDSRRVHCRHLKDMEAIAAGDLEKYHRQLFYWLLIRGGPCIFPAHLALNDGVPAELPAEN